MCKNLVELIDSFDILLEAQDYAERHPSTAEDSSTDKRFVQYVMTRVLNKMNSLMEVSDTQAAAALLGMEAGMCSEIFWVYDSKSHMNYIWDEKQQQMCTNKDSGSSMSTPFGDSDNSDDSDDSDEESLDDCFGEGNTSDTESATTSMDDAAAHGIDAHGARINQNSGGVDEGAGIGGGSVWSSEHLNDDGRNYHIDDSHDFDCPFEATYHDVNNDYGSCPFYKTEDGQGLEPVPWPVLYRFRGIHLRDLNRWEYWCLVRVVKTTTETYDGAASNKPKRGRPSSRRFEFGGSPNDIPILHSHHQILRSKQCTLKFLQNPPCHPGPCPPPEAPQAEQDKWVRRANRFAQYFLVLFRPESELYTNGQSNKYKYDWKTFVKFTQSLKNSEFEIDRLRFEIMERVAHGWRTKRRNRAILSKYRNRNRTIWSKQQQMDATAEFGVRSSQSQSNLEGDELFEEYGNDKRKQQLSPKEEKDVLGHVSYTDDLVHTLENTDMARPSTMSETELPKHRDKVVRTCQAKFSLAASLLDARPQDHENNDATSDDEDDSCRPPPSEEEVMRVVDSFLQDQQLSPDKMVAVNIMMEHYKIIYRGLDNHLYKPPVIIITGGPGTGKSYLVKVFRGISDIMKVGEQVRAAYFGIAAVNIDGSSLCSLMDIPTDFKGASKKEMRPWHPDKLKEFKRRYDVSNISVIIIDEISTVKAELIGYVNRRLKEARPGIDKPFGGIAVIFMGDFDQLPPVAGNSIPATIMKREEKRRKSRRQYASRSSEAQITSAAGCGANLFKDAVRINLTTQHRSEDEAHTQLLEKMSAGETLITDD